MEVRLQQLTKRFGSVVAVDDLTLTLADGEIVGLLGPSGCGKSTTLFMLAGLLAPDGGEIWFGDENVTRVTPERRGIGLVFQNYALYPHMTVLQNILFPLQNLKMEKTLALATAEEMAELVQIKDLLSRKPSELSGGQQQRVAIARALAKKPKLLLLDEPLSNLDARLRMETREEIRRIQREVQITAVFVTHDQEEAMSISDRIAVIREGKLQQYDLPQRIYKTPANRFVATFLGSPPINLLDAQITAGQLTAGDTALAPAPGMADGPAHVGIRPEAFVQSPDGFPVTVQKAELLGRDIIVTFPLGSQAAKAILSSDSDIKPGDTLLLRVKPGQILQFDPATLEMVGCL